MTTSKCGPLRAALEAISGSLAIVLLTLAALSSTASASTIGGDSLSLATSSLRMCQSHPHRHCDGFKAHLSRLQQIAHRAPAARLSGTTISWKRVPAVKSYVLARQTQGTGFQYSVVKTTKVTPAPQPDQTVDYWVRTNVSGSSWTAAIPISYQGQTPQTSSGSHSNPNTTVTTTTVSHSSSDSAPAPSSSTTSSVSGQSPNQTTSGASPSLPAQLADPNFQVGINSGPELNRDVKGSEILGAKLVRLAWPIGTSPQEMEPVIEGYAQAGIRVAPVATFTGTMPTPSQALSLAGWAKVYGPQGTFWSGRSDGGLAIRTIEFGNETDAGYQYGDEAGERSYTERAETYAERFKEAAIAIDSSNSQVGLLAQADDTSGDWVNGMYAAVPNLSDYVSGWTIHPYGNQWKPRIEDLIAQVSAHGAPSTIPIDLTEWGVTTDNGRCLDYNEGLNPCMSYEEAANTLKSTFSQISEMLGNRLGMFLLYQVRDEEQTGATTNWQGYFGALQHGLQAKGSYTSAVQTLMSIS